MTVPFRTSRMTPDAEAVLAHSPHGSPSRQTVRHRKVLRAARKLKEAETPEQRNARLAAFAAAIGPNVRTGRDT